jgi:hypothetical protein
MTSDLGAISLISQTFLSGTFSTHMTERPARAAARLPQGPILRPVASHAAPQRRAGAPDDATRGATHARSAGVPRSATCAPRCRTGAADRAADLSALSAGADDLHPSAHPTTGDGTMIRTTRLCRCLVFLRRVLPRQGVLLSPPQPMRQTSPQMMPPTGQLSSPLGPVRPAPGLLTGDPGPRHQAPRLKSP